MSEKYVIKWTSKVNGQVGQGTKLFTREEAQRLANELNTEYPDIGHLAVPADSSRERAPAPAEASDTETDVPASTRIQPLSFR